ncbi:DUF3263 domain-containing protein [Rhodococcus aetherivorans]
MTSDERAMLAFVLRWSPFGGGDDYILPEFGLTPAAFYRRVLALLTLQSGGTDVATRAHLRQFCVSKLSQLGQPKHFTPDDPTTSSTVRLSPVNIKDHP